MDIISEFYDSSINKVEDIDALFESYDLIDMKSKSARKDFELQNFFEDADSTESIQAFLEAEEAADAQKSNILSRIIQAISAIFNSIVKSIKSVFGKQDAEEEVEAADMSGVLAKLREIKTNLSEIISDILHFRLKEAGAKIKNGPVKGLIAAFAAISIGSLAVIKIKRSKAEKDAAEIADAAEDLNAKIKDIESKKDSVLGKKIEGAVDKHGIINTVLKYIKTMANKLKEFSVNAINTVKGVFKGKSNDGERTNPQVRGQKKDKTVHDRNRYSTVASDKSSDKYQNEIDIMQPKDVDDGRDSKFKFQQLKTLGAYRIYNDGSVRKQHPDKPGIWVIANPNTDNKIPPALLKLRDKWRKEGKFDGWKYQESVTMPFSFYDVVIEESVQSELLEDYVINVVEEGDAIEFTPKDEYEESVNRSIFGDIDEIALESPEDQEIINLAKMLNEL